MERSAEKCTRPSLPPGAMPFVEKACRISGYHSRRPRGQAGLAAAQEKRRRARPLSEGLTVVSLDD